ncbi:hypothetical protein F7725_000787 [Dissostichus mawsoni]|uniref:Protein SEC13 homolog n=1 Tax=Dissostichus mawsoni TaxID=36200 RepID=A0A7J5ZFE4_DISMA|nr:hypothetical protein F7725_000787 [Dissostichus mawsoni]
MCEDGRVFIWTCDDPAGNTWTAKLLHKFNDVVWHVSWSITGNILAVSGGDNKIISFSFLESKTSQQQRYLQTKQEYDI